MLSNQPFGNSVPTTLKRQMDSFDALPADLRAVLRDTVTDWCAYSFHLRVRQGIPFDRQRLRLIDEDRWERKHYHAFNAQREQRARRGEASPPRLFPTPSAHRDAEHHGQGRLL